MRLSVALSSLAARTNPARAFASILLCLCAVGCFPPSIAAQNPAPGSERERLHETEQWRQVEEHLPDPATASPQILEQQADILRARRFPEDALDFYKYALARGGEQAALLNKIGLTQLEMHNVELARASFKRAVKIGAKDPDVWNNLGAVEYLDSGAQAAIADYKHAIKLDRNQAVFHANLATAYFETRNFDGARREMAAALKLDSGIFDSGIGTGGIQAHVLSSEDRARFAFEMAKIDAGAGQLDQMLRSLARASEVGMDIQREMRHDPVLGPFENDPRVAVIVHNAHTLQAGGATVSASSAGSDPALPKQKAE